MRTLNLVQTFNLDNKNNIILLYNTYYGDASLTYWTEAGEKP